MAPPESRRQAFAVYGAVFLAAALGVKLLVFDALYIVPAAPAFTAGLMALVSDLCILAAACALLLLVRRRWFRFGTVAAANVLLTLLFYANVIHFRFFGDVIGIYKFGMAGMVDDAAIAVRPLLGILDPLIFIDLIVTGAWAAFGIAYFPAPRLWGRLSESLRERLHRSPRRLPLGLAGGAVAVALLVQLLWRPIAVPEPFSTAEVMSRSSMLVYYTGGAMRALVGSRPKVERVELLEEVCTCGAEDMGPKVRAAIGKDARPNFMLVQVESLNPEALVPEIMPNLCALAERGISFTNFHSFAHLSLTFRGEYALMTSLYPPLGETVTYPVAGSIGEGGLIGLLRRAGYATWFFHGYSGAYYNRRANYLGWGIESFYAQEELAALGVKAGGGFGRGPYGPGIDDADMSRAVPEILSPTRRPYFAVYATLSSHFPYAPPGDEEGDAGDANEYDAAYLRMMSYVDRELGVLIEGLRSRGLLDDTYLIVYSDHQGRMEDRARYHEKLRSPSAERIAAFLEQHRVPCVISGPGIGPGIGAGIGAARSEMRSSHLDIGPTVLGLAGIEMPSGRRKMMGRSLLRTCTRRVWALPTLTNAVVLAGPGRFGVYGVRSRLLTFYDTEGDSHDAGAGSPSGPAPEEEARYRAVISRVLYSNWVFMREGRYVYESN